MGLFKPNIRKLEEKQDIDGLIEILYYEKDSSTRLKAARALGKIKNPDSIVPLMTALADDSNEVREEIVKALCVFSNSKVILSLIASLKDKSENVHRAAVNSLIRIGEPAVEPLIKTLKDSDDNICKSILEILTGIGEPSVESLLSLLKESDGKVRRFSAKVLGEIGDERAVEPLVTVLKKSDWDVRRTIAEALEKIGLSFNQNILVWYYLGMKDWDKLVSMGDLAVEPLIIALKDSDKTVRKDVVKALEKIGLPNDKVVQTWFYLEKDDRIKLKSLGNLAVESLIDALNDSEWKVISNAAYALGNTKDGRAVEPLIAALKNNYLSMSSVAEALGEIGDRRAVMPLIGILGTEWASKYAISALGKIGDSRAVIPLISVLYRKLERESAAIALVEIGDGSAVEPLINVLKENNEKEVYRSAAYVLATLYQQNKIDEKNKQKIFTAKDLIENSHIDTHVCALHFDDPAIKLGGSIKL